MGSTLILKVVGVFLLGLGIDLVYVWYLQSVMQRAKIKAGVLSVCLAAPAMFGWFAVYEERILVVPYMLGLFMGTVLAIDLQKGEH